VSKYNKSIVIGHMEATMIIQCERKEFIVQDDLIAITRDDRLIGYGKVIALLEEHVLVDIDKKASKSLFEIFSENIACDFTFVNERYCPQSGELKKDI
jgi:hypothetical protein